MQRDFPLKDAISDLIMEYNTYGLLDQLQRRWYGRAPCLENSLANLRKPKPLSVRALAGVFIMLFIGMCIGVCILIAEHFLFKYGLPRLRKKGKDCFWKSPNLMFFSQVRSGVLLMSHSTINLIIETISLCKVALIIFSIQMNRNCTDSSTPSNWFHLITRLKRSCRI